MIPNVFISYAWGDRDVAEIICAGLEASGIDCWIAPRDILPDHSPVTSLTHAVSQCKVLVLLVSHHLANATGVTYQLEWAVSTDTFVCPVRIADIPLTETLTLLIGQVQWLDAITQPFEHHVPVIAGAVRELLSRPEPSTPQSEMLQTPRENQGDWLDFGTELTADASLNQRNAIADRVKHFHMMEKEFHALRQTAEECIRRKNFADLEHAIDGMVRLRPLDGDLAALISSIDRPRHRVSKYALISPFVAGLSILWGAFSSALFSAFPTLFSARQAEIYSLLVWLFTAIAGSALGYIALAKIRRKDRDYYGKTGAWIGIALGLLMATGSVLVLATDKEASSAPPPANAHILKGKDLNKQGNYDQAIQEYSLAIRDDPTDIDPLYERACIYWIDKQDYQKALADLNRAIEINQTVSYLFWARGNVYLAQGDSMRALVDFNEDIRLRGTRLDYLDFRDRAQAYLALKNYDLALSDDSRALELCPASDTSNRARISESLSDARNLQRGSQGANIAHAATSHP